MHTKIHTQSKRETTSKVMQRLVSLLVLSILIVGIAVAFWDSKKVKSFFEQVEWFHITDVQIESEWPVTIGDVKRWIPPLKGKSIFFIHPQSLISTLEKKSWIKEVIIKKEFPDLLLIQVKTKKAKAIVHKKGRLFYVDAWGQNIEKVTSESLKKLDLPIISKRSEKREDLWKMRWVMNVLDVFKRRMQSKYKISQLVLGGHPYFSLFLASPQIEIEFDIMNWEKQLSHLVLLLSNPPGQLGQINKISLLFPKKAVVRSPISN